MRKLEGNQEKGKYVQKNEISCGKGMCQGLLRTSYFVSI